VAFATHFGGIYHTFCNPPISGVSPMFSTEMSGLFSINTEILVFGGDCHRNECFYFNTWFPPISVVFAMHFGGGKYPWHLPFFLLIPPLVLISSISSIS
jgi:hypothetical protein